MDACLSIKTLHKNEHYPSPLYCWSNPSPSGLTSDRRVPEFCKVYHHHHNISFYHHHYHFPQYHHHHHQYWGTNVIVIKTATKDRQLMDRYACPKLITFFIINLSSSSWLKPLCCSHSNDSCSLLSSSSYHFHQP